MTQVYLQLTWGGEYYHLFCSLKSHFGYSEDKSLESIKKIHENSQVYHFSGGN